MVCGRRNDIGVRFPSRFKAFVHEACGIVGMRWVYRIVQTVKTVKPNLIITTVSNWIGKLEAIQDDKTDNCHLSVE